MLAHHSLHILECGDFSESAGQDMMLRMKGLEAMVLMELNFRIESDRAATLIIDQAFTFVSSRTFIRNIQPSIVLLTI